MNSNKNKEIYSNRVLVITKEGAHRENIRNNLMNKGGFKVDFISNYRNAVAIINEFKPGVCLHDWDSFDTDQNCMFHQMIAKMDSLSFLCRVVFAKQITSTMFAVSHDTGIDRVITLTNLQLNVVEEINMARASISNISSLQQLTRSINRGTENYNQTEIDKAIIDAYESYPYDNIVKVEFGNLCLRNNKIKKAETIGEELLNKDPNNVRAMNLLSRIYMKQNRLEDAIEILENANLLSPKNSKRLISLGNLCIQKKNMSKAKNYFQEAYETAPEDDDTKESLIQFEMDHGNPNDALDLFKKSMSEEEVAGFLNNYGIQCVHHQKYDEALKFYDLAINSLKTNKYVPQIYFNMSLAHRRLKNYSECITCSKKALKYNPDFLKASKQIVEIEKLFNLKSNAK